VPVHSVVAVIAAMAERGTVAQAPRRRAPGPRSARRERRARPSRGAASRTTRGAPATESLEERTTSGRRLSRKIAKDNGVDITRITAPASADA
jgi:hypothetical protein